MTLQGKRIVVLGGSSGIGLAVAQAAAREGAAVVIASSRQARVDDALRILPEGVEGYAVDLAGEPAVRALLADVGSFDHLVFTAGESLQLDRLANTDVDAARRFFGLRYWGLISPPNTAVAVSATADRLSLPPALPGSDRDRAGPWRLVSAPRWRV